MCWSFGLSAARPPSRAPGACAFWKSVKRNTSGQLTDPLAQLLNGRLDRVDVDLVGPAQVLERLARALDLLDFAEHFAGRFRIKQLAHLRNARLELAHFRPQALDLLDLGPVFELRVLHPLFLALLRQLLLALALEEV